MLAYKSIVEKIAEYEETHLIEQQLFDTVVYQFSIPEFTKSLLSDPESKWLAISALQKCIRRGDVETAMTVAYALEFTDPEHLWRRLPIIAMEDIGIADLELVATTCFLARQNSWRKKNGGAYLTVSLVNRLCHAVKDRCSDMIYISAYTDPAGLPTLLDYARNGYGRRELSKLFADYDNDPIDRTFKGLVLMGKMTAKDKDRKYYIKGDKVAFQQALHSFSKEPLMRYVCQRGLSNVIGFTAVLPIILQHFTARGEAEVKEQPLPAINFIGAFPEITYDMHTQIGKKALKLIHDETEEVQEILRDEQPKNVVKLLGKALFLIEGSKSERKLFYGFSDEMEQRSIEVFARTHNVSVGTFNRLVGFLLEHPDLIRDARRTAVEGAG